MNILVTGGAGYIGSAVAYRLKHHYGANVVLLDNLSNGNKQAARLTGCQLYIGDICDYDAVYDMIKQCKIDICIHCAASIDATESVKDPYKYFRNNVFGTSELLQALQDNGVKKIVFSSSILAKVEQNPYGWTKQSCETMLQQVHEAYGLSYISLRFENVAGATERFSQWHKHNQTHLIPNIVDVAYGDKEYLTVYGTGDAVRDYVHIEDIVYAHERAVAMLQNLKSEATYTLGSGNCYSVLDVIQTASQITGRRIPIVFEDSRKDKVPNFRGPDALHESHQQLEYVKRELLWEPTKTLKHIIESAWEWKKAHPKGYKDDRT